MKSDHMSADLSLLGTDIESCNFSGSGVNFYVNSMLCAQWVYNESAYQTMANVYNKDKYISHQVCF